jgi:hypothetical protein
MPITKQLRVKVENIAVGDTVTIKGTSGVVRGFRELQKNMLVTIGGDDWSQDRRLPLDSEINVLRTESTEEEVLVERVTAFNTWAVKRMTEAHKTMEHRFNYMREQYQKSVERNHLYPFDLDFAGQVAQAQEWDALWRSVEAHAGSKSWVKAVWIVREGALRFLLQGDTPLSRSTSTLGNLEKDLRREAAARFIEDLRWSDFDSLVEAFGYNNNNEK